MPEQKLEVLVRILRYCRQLMAEHTGTKKINCETLTRSGSDTKRTSSLIVMDDLPAKALSMLLHFKSLGKIAHSIAY